MTSQTSIPIFSNTTLSSLTSAMFTARKMFSSSFVASATRVDDTGTVVATTFPYRVLASSRHDAVMPLTTLGIVDVVKLGLPGSSRSGE